MPVGSPRSLDFNASLPVFVTALRFFTNERSDSLLSSIPVAGTTTVVSRPVVIPEFTDGAGWSSQVILVNTSDAQMRGEIHFVSQGSLSDPPQGIEVGTGVGTASVFEYDIPPRSFYRLQTNGLMDNLSVGSVQIVPFFGFNEPAAHAIISNHVDGNTIFETSIEGQLPATNFRLHAEAIGEFDAGKPKSTRTAIAIANPSATPATVQLEVTSFDGVRLGTSSPVQIPANGQVAWFLNQVPGLESVNAPFQGIVRLTELTGAGVTAASFRMMLNERLDHLITTTGPLNEDAGIPGRLIFPYMTDSTGYTAQFILVNPPGVQNITGVLHYLSTDGSPLQIDTLRLGSLQIVPFIGFNTPHAHVILNHRDGGVLTSQTSVEGELPGTHFRMYAESIGDFPSGCRFAPRCPIAKPECAMAIPELVEVESQRWVRCPYWK